MRILVLNGLSVSVELFHDILCCQSTDCPSRRPCESDSRPCPACYPGAIQCPVPNNVRILSIRQSDGFNGHYLADIISYITRSDRPKDSPRIQGIYYFGTLDNAVDDSVSYDNYPVPAEGVTTTPGSQLGMLTSLLPSSSHAWYAPGRVEYVPGIAESGELVYKPDERWGMILDQCKGTIFFDTINCQNWLPWKWDRSRGGGRMKRCTSLADVCLGSRACQDCNSYPQGDARYTGEPSADLPLLSPPPLHSSSIADAQRVAYGSIDTKDLILRAWCDECLYGRHCSGCGAFWFGKCYPFDYEDEDSLRVSREHTRLKVYLGLCVARCLVETFNEAGSDGMWG